MVNYQTPKVISQSYAPIPVETKHPLFGSLATDSDPVKSLKRKQYVSYCTALLFRWHACPSRQEPLIGHNKKVQLLNKTSSPTPKPLTTNIFEDDARARREKRFEREAQIEQSKQNTTAGWGNHYSSGTNFVLPLAARIQGGKHFNRSWAAEPAPVADPVRPVPFIALLLIYLCNSRMS